MRLLSPDYSGLVVLGLWVRGGWCEPEPPPFMQVAWGDLRLGLWLRAELSCGKGVLAGMGDTGTGESCLRW